jgi:hypothetical protein
MSQLSHTLTTADDMESVADSRAAAENAREIAKRPRVCPNQQWADVVPMEDYR